MNKKIVVVYGKQEIELSRVYPFGTVKNIGTDEKPNEVTVIVANELNGKDEETIAKNSHDKLEGFVTISVATGLTYDEVLMMASKDSLKTMEVLKGF